MWRLTRAISIGHFAIDYNGKNFGVTMLLKRRDCLKEPLDAKSLYKDPPCRPLTNAISFDAFKLKASTSSEEVRFEIEQETENGVDLRIVYH